MISLSNLLSEIELDGGIGLRPGDPLFLDGKDLIFIKLIGDFTILYGKPEKIKSSVRRNQIIEKSFENTKIVQLKNGPYFLIENVIDEQTAEGRHLIYIREMPITQYNDIKDLNV